METFSIIVVFTVFSIIFVVDDKSNITYNEGQGHFRC